MLLDVRYCDKEFKYGILTIIQTCASKVKFERAKDHARCSVGLSFMVLTDSGTHF